MARKNSIGQTVGKIIIGGVGMISGVTQTQLSPAHIAVNKPATQLNSVVKQQDKQRREGSQPARQTQDKAQKK